MLKRSHYLWPHHGPVPAASTQLEREGHCLLRNVFPAADVDSLRRDIERVYAEYAPDRRSDGVPAAVAAAFRYEMCNRSAACVRALANPTILAALEPLLGDDCHVISCTAWRNAPGPLAAGEACYWHTDAGPHVPRDEHVAWPQQIPYPVFVVACHIYLAPCTLDDGPTTVVPTSHTSGRPVPPERRDDEVLTYDGHQPVSHVAAAGDVGFFVSDSWHRRRTPTPRSNGRFFLQVNYGRRDIAQRLLPSVAAQQVHDDVLRDVVDPRIRTLLGLHGPGFYDG